MFIQGIDVFLKLMKSIMENTVTIQDVMKAHINVTIDKEYYNKLNRYRLGWCNKSNDYTQFLGSNLTGVHVIRFSDYDEDKLFVDLLNVDKTTLETELHNLKEVKKERNISSDVYYLTTIYMIYLTSISRIPQELKNDIIEEHYYLLAYKMMSSLYTHYFKFPVEPSIAKAVYEKLSNHFIIKTEGSWQKVFEYRAKNDILPGGLWYKRLVKFDTNMAIKIANDLQGRLREILKFIYKVLIQVKDANSKISSSSLIESDDESGESIKDNPNRSDTHIAYLTSIFNKTTDFVNDDLIYLINQFYKNVNVEHLTKTLRYMSENIELNKEKFNVVETILLNTFEYINKKDITHEYNKHIGVILLYIKGVWSTSSVKDKDIIECKKYLNEVVKRATGIKTQWYITGIVISIAMYVFARSVYRNQY